jgi:N-acetylglucosamine kinase-like BadF-type ATPase
VSDRVIVAVDGGNSKTDLALVGADGRLIALARGPGSSPHRIGAEGCVTVIAELLATARDSAGRAGVELGRPAAAVILVAGADLDSEERELRERVARRGWADVLEIGNDTLAVLRAGSDSGYGVAVVCGAGINAIGLAPDGRRTRFPALGAITGDWGGGGDVGLAALGKAVRAEDGRGPATELAELVPRHFSLASAEDVALALHRRELDQGRLVELAPIVLEVADAGDSGAVELRERLVEEIVGFVRAAASKVLADVERYDVVLGGSLLSRSHTLLALVAERVRAELPSADPRPCRVPPVAGSALIGIDLLSSGDGAGAAAVLRAEFEQLSTDDDGGISPRRAAGT